jgi:hypothetical protein
MNRKSWGLTLPVCVCAVVLVGAIVDQACAVQKKNRELSRPSVSEQSHKPSPEQDRNRTRGRSKKTIAPVGPKQQLDVLRRRAEQDPAVSKTPRRKGSRPLKASKKIRQKADVQPRTDLMYHGLLEDPRRYDPRPNYHAAGVQNPQTPSLTYDHFQELDHNQDGKIDPIERAFGRLDLDRDLHNRPLQ